MCDERGSRDRCKRGCETEEMGPADMIRKAEERMNVRLEIRRW